MNFNSLLSAVSSNTSEEHNINNSSKESIDDYLDDILIGRTKEEKSSKDLNMSNEKFQIPDECNLTNLKSENDTRTYNIETSQNLKYIQVITASSVHQPNQEIEIKSMKLNSSIKQGLLHIANTDKFYIKPITETFSPKLKLNTVYNKKNIIDVNKNYKQILQTPILSKNHSELTIFSIKKSESVDITEMISNISCLQEENISLRNENSALKVDFKKMWEDNQILFSKLKFEQELRRKDENILSEQKKQIVNLHEVIKDIKLSLNKSTSSKLLTSESNISYTINNESKINKSLGKASINKENKNISYNQNDLSSKLSSMNKSISQVKLCHTEANNQTKSNDSQLSKQNDEITNKIIQRSNLKKDSSITNYSSPISNIDKPISTNEQTMCLKSDKSSAKEKEDFNKLKSKQVLNIKNILLKNEENYSNTTANMSNNISYSNSSAFVLNKKINCNSQVNIFEDEKKKTKHAHLMEMLKSKGNILRQNNDISNSTTLNNVNSKSRIILNNSKSNDKIRLVILKDTNLQAACNTEQRKIVALKRPVNKSKTKE